MAFQNPPISLTLPTGAGAGQTRIVIGPKLPPPLDTYMFPAPVFGGSDETANSAILFYQGTASNDDYVFLAMVNHGTAHAVYLGSVFNGAVVADLDGVSPGGLVHYFTSSNIAYNEVKGLNLRGPGRFRMLPEAQGIHTYNNFQMQVTTVPAGDATTTIRFPTVDTGTWPAITVTSPAGSGAPTVDFSTYDLKYSGSAPSINRSTAAVNLTGAGSNVYGTTGTVAGVAFTAPPSGSVKIDWTMEGSNATAGTFNLTSIRVGTTNVVGGGAQIFAPSDDVTIRIQGGSGTFRFGASEIVDGLTPGTVYNVAQMHRTSSTASTFVIARRTTIVTPNLS